MIDSARRVAGLAGAGQVRVAHYEEFARLVEGVPDDALPVHVANALENEQHHLHFQASRPVLLGRVKARFSPMTSGSFRLRG